MTTSEKSIHIPLPSCFGLLPFTRGVLVGDAFHLAGHIGIDPAKKKVPGKIEAAVQVPTKSIRDTLGEVGQALRDLVHVHVSCPDVALFDRFNAVNRTYFQDPLPARAFLSSGSSLFGAHSEIPGTAVNS